MAYNINTALENLEKNLEKVESARQQVQNTVVASNSLRQIVEKYSDTLASLNKEVATFIEEIQNYQNNNTSDIKNKINEVGVLCDEVVKNFETEIKQLANGFNNEFSEIVTKFDSENVRLGDSVNKLTSLQSILNRTISEVGKIDEKVDSMARNQLDIKKQNEQASSDIKSSIDALLPSIYSQFNSTVSKIQTLASQLDQYHKDINVKVSTEISKLDTVISTLADVKNKCNLIEDSIGGVKKSVNINRWIAIIGIVTLGCLYMFVH